MNNKNLGWLFILIAGIFEIVWAAALDLSENFTNIPWSVLFVVGLVISMYFLSKGISSGLPIGTAYAVWVGIGAIGVFVLGMAVFGEPVEWIRIGFVTLIIIGIVGLQLTSPEGGHE